MSTTYPDLTNDFPDVESDERYLYRDITVDDIAYITQYETLLSAVKTASDDSGRQTAWEALNTFKDTDDYKNHVEPVMMTASKLQTLEDKTISAQRFAKRQKQQWQISDTQPESNVQAVNDIWLKTEHENEEKKTTTAYFKDEDGEYKELAIGIRTRVVTELPESPDPYTFYIVTEK